MRLTSHEIGEADGKLKDGVNDDADEASCPSSRANPPFVFYNRDDYSHEKPDRASPCMRNQPNLRRLGN
jgi:hypothetical protein